MLTSSLPGLLQNQSLEKKLICNVVLCLPHDHVACIHMCDECMRSHELSVCHMLVHFVTARASLFTDHGTLGLPIRVNRSVEHLFQREILHRIFEWTTANCCVQDWTDSCVASKPSSYTGSLFIARFSA